jgi:GNAT superfamily N-acetyltransferase
MIKLKQLIFESIDESNVHVISTPDNVSIMYRVGPVRSSVASIDRVDGHQWWVARVLVGDRNTRGQGIGSYLIQRAVKEVLKHDPQADILVEPGGYDSNTEQQVNFYKKNGFVEHPKYEGSLTYKK